MSSKTGGYGCSFDGQNHTYLDVSITVDEFNGIFKTPEAASKTFHQKISNRSRTALHTVGIMYSTVSKT
jgi:hypothetical protein